MTDAGEACDAGGANSDLPGAGCRSDCRFGGCGDGIVDPGEECDARHANADVPGAPCRTSCVVAGCGDGIVDPDEACDLGGANSNLPGAGCRTDCMPAGCGDGIVDPGEACDAGPANSNAPDAACRLDCTPARCGDGVKDTGEDCDDGNLLDGDGCDAACLLEAGCGNGVLEPGELCDDGNLAGGDGCSATCRKLVSDDFSGGALDPGVWTTVDPLGDATFAVVGAGTAAAALEIGVPGGTAHDAWLPNNAPRVVQSVDNSNFDVVVRMENALWAANQFQGVLVEEDQSYWMRFDLVADGAEWRAVVIRRTGGTPSTIRNVALGAVPSPGLVWLRVTRVGNTWTYRWSTDGTTWTGVGASFTASILVRQVGLLAGNAVGNPGFTARFDYLFDAAAPLVPEDPSACGDGVTDAGEACDAGGANSDLPGAGCRSDCRFGGCGDGIVDPGEECDARDANADVPGAPCRTTCVVADCGDGIVDPDEACDLGGANSDLPGASCRTDCTPAGCGDGIVDPGEACDDGLANSNAPDAACRPDCTPSRCGDGVEDTGEDCDDGNLLDGDGC
ncbi:MAG: DUF4215 domain-containing protein, partial [Synechococcaceae cyanobacterium]|nr:DUF4215 domain-containing protein [Synechococcaceae cyanobacterium]